MAIPDNISTALAGQPDVLKFVNDLDVKAGKLTPEIEAALPNLGKLPEFQTSAAALAKILADTKAENAEKLLADFANLKTVNADLVKQRDAWKAGGKGTDSPEYKALEEKLTTTQTEFTTKLAEITGKLDAEAAAKVTAVKAEKETSLKASVVTAAAKHKIKDPDDEFTLLKAKGLVGHKEDGTPFFYKLNEKGEKVDAGSAEALMKHIAETAKHKVDPSGKTGTGTDHRGAGGDNKEAPKSAADARKAYYG